MPLLEDSSSSSFLRISFFSGEFIIEFIMLMIFCGEIQKRTCSFNQRNNISLIIFISSSFSKDSQLYFFYFFIISSIFFISSFNSFFPFNISYNSFILILLISFCSTIFSMHSKIIFGIKLISMIFE